MASSRRVVLVALAGNLLVAATKFVAAALTGSSSLLSEGFHSMVDCGNELLLLYGYRRAARPPDRLHPFGYGRELYFWSFVVALLLFALGAGLSVYEGVQHMRAPQPLQRVGLSYAVLAASALFEGVSWVQALRAFRRVKGEDGWWRAVRDSKDPPAFMVLLEDTAALFGLAIAALGVFLADHYDRPELDGAASIVIGLLLAATALLLARETKDLLIGERANRRITDSLIDLARADSRIDGANGALTVHMAPDQIVAALSLEFADRLTTPEIERSVADLETRIRTQHPEVIALFVKPQTRTGFERSLAHRAAG